MIKSNKARFLLILVCAFVLVGVNINGVCAAKAIPSKSLPPVVEAYLQYQSSLANLNTSQIDQMRALWIERLAKNQEMLDSTYGGVAQRNMDSLDFINYPGYLFQFSHVEYFYGGLVTESLNAFGQADGSFARLYTPQIDGMASIVGEMSSTNCAGAIYVQAKLGPTGSQHEGNYVMIEVNDNDDYDTWEGWMQGFVGYAHITSNDEVSYYVGVAPYSFKYLSVGCIAMGGICSYNDVLVDSVGSSVGNSPVTITLSPSEHGSSAVWDSLGNYLGGPGSYLVTRGDYAQVYAFPDSTYALDHWHLDGNDAGNNDPYLVMMDSGHSVQPIFGPATSYPLVTQAYSVYWGWLNPVQSNVWVDGNWIGTTQTSVLVSPGYHTVTFDQYVWEYSQQVQLQYLLVNGNQYYNGQSILITSETWVVAIYNA